MSCQSAFPVKAVLGNVLPEPKFEEPLDDDQIVEDLDHVLRMRENAQAHRRPRRRALPRRYVPSMMSAQELYEIISTLLHQ